MRVSLLMNISDWLWPRSWVHAPRLGLFYRAPLH